MEDLFKKFLYTGVGIVSTTAEKVQKSVDELVQKGKLSEEEGKKVVDDMVADTKSKREEMESRLRELIDNALSKVDFPSRREVERLNARIAELEAKLAESKKAQAKVTE